MDTVQTPRRKLEIDAELQLSEAHVFAARLHHSAPDTHMFRRDRVYWLDYCLTPRRPKASARFADYWSANRYFALGALVAFPPHKRLELRSSGGDHASVICEINADVVEKWYPPEFSWTDRRFETVLDIANDTIRALMLKLNAELKSDVPGRRELCDSVITQLSIELARHIVMSNERDERRARRLATEIDRAAVE